MTNGVLFLHTGIIPLVPDPNPAFWEASVTQLGDQATDFSAPSPIPTKDLMRLFQDAPILFCVLSVPDFRFIYVNRALDELLMRSNIVGRRFVEALPELVEQGYVELFEEACNTGGAISRQGHALALQPSEHAKELRYVDFIIQPVREPEGKIRALVCTGYNVTNALHSALEAARLTEELFDTRRSMLVEGLAASVAHELKQPLAASTNYLGAADALLQNSNVEKAREMISAAEGQVRRANEIVNGLRALAGARIARREVVDLRIIINEVIDSVAAAGNCATEGKCDDVGFHIESELDDPCVRCDPAQVFKIVANLLRNSCKAMSGNGGEIQITLRSAEHNMVEVIVEDQGPGFPEEMQQSGPRMGASTTGGLGIGLVLSEALVQAHGGRLYLQNAEGGGARASFTLPQATV